MKNICVIGTGYVGLVTGACFAELGNNVRCVDTDVEKIAILSSGSVPFYEPGLREMVARNVARRRLSFTTSISLGMSDARFVFLAVGTPSKANGEADVCHVRAAAQAVAQNVNCDTIVVNKSTVPVETGDLVRAIVCGDARRAFKVLVASNPEFLREGSAITDFMHPDRVVLGVYEPEAAEALTDLYAPLSTEIMVTDVRTAEMIKYTANAFLATKISFINEIANICDAVGADVKSVVRAAGADKRIGTAFMNAGLGFGGSCFPKDVQALAHLADSKGIEPRVLRATLDVNEEQVRRLVQRLAQKLDGLSGRTVAVLGLAFKPDTDDVRESRSIALVNTLVDGGARVVAHDPMATQNARPHLRSGVLCVDTPYIAAADADALIVATEWNEYKQLDLEQIRRSMCGNLFVDARNVYDSRTVGSAGLEHMGIGRGTVSAGQSAAL